MVADGSAIAFVVGIAILLLASGTWLFAAIILAAGAALHLVLGFPLERIGAVLKGITWKTISSWELAAVPLFIWLGEIVFRTDISERLFRGLTPWVSRVPGRLLHTNVLSSALFAAVCGSSVATTATVGKITTQELLRRGYARGLSVGSLAGAGSLGLLIPPSIIMLVYGLVADVSILRLFAAGLVPGLIFAALFSAYIIVRCLATPALAPSDPGHFGLSDMLRGLGDLSPILALIAMVFGALYSGLATASEAAAIGVVGALFIAFITRQLSWELLRSSGISAITTSTMIGLLVVAANFLASAMGYLHVPQSLASEIRELQLPPLGLIAILVVFYFLLGGLLDGVSMVVMTTPIVLPLVVGAGYDPIWFGVFLVAMSEVATITPPIGFNLFVLQSLTGSSIGYTARAAAPFFLLMLFGCALLVLFPSIALWLPSLLY